MKTTMKEHVHYIAPLVCIALVILLILGIWIVPLFVRNSYTVEVTGKERIYTSNENASSSYYLVFAKELDGDVKVFKNSDELLLGKFGSSNIQAGMEIGGTYDVDVYGFRVPFLSWYENIVRYSSAKELSE